MIRRPATLLLACVLLLTSTAALGRTAVVPPSASELRSIVETLAAPEMDGRRAGTPGGERATNRIAEWLAAAGLRPGGDGGSFLQSFTLAPGRRLGPASTLEIGGRGCRYRVLQYDDRRRDAGGRQGIGDASRARRKLSHVR